jgi:RpiR family carbohydrate utilization transcriptional regulator
MHLLDRIEEQLSHLPPSEARVGQWLTDHLRESASLTIADVARAADVSEPTVIRFCRSLNLGGFRDLRAEIISALHEPETYLHRDVTPADTSTVATGKVVDSCIRALIEASLQIPGLPLSDVVDQLAGARQSLFCGLGASGHVARDAQHKFFRIGVPCSTALDGPTIVQSAAIADSRDAFIFISHTGTWPELVNAITSATRRGATTIAITDPGSPLARAATIELACRAKEDTSAFTPMSSRLVHLALLDGIQVSLALKLGTSAERSLRLSKESLNEMRQEARNSKENTL